jgi:uncharacterized membrane protein YphA (DoxX/SURF4 family)
MESRVWGKRLSWPLQILVWALTLYIAYYLVPAGYGKVFDFQFYSFFEELGLPFWLFITVGIVEIAGPLLMLVPKLSFYAALPTVAVMASASYFNGWSIDTISYAVIALIVAILMRPGFLKKSPPITTISI